ncbi:MAG: RNA polymerase sigma factor [Cyclobacteriaceae bacterium]
MKLKLSYISQNERISAEPQQNPLAVSDTDTWKSFKEGDESAFIRIYKDYIHILFNYGCQFSGDRDLIKDCLQDFFIELRRRREHLSDTNNIKFYLLKSFRRRLLHDQERELKVKIRSENLKYTQFEVELSHEVKLIDSQMENSKLEKLNAAMESLPSREREAIYHFYYENLSYSEIADILQLGHVSSARRIIYRALENLRDYIIASFLVLFI